MDAETRAALLALPTLYGTREVLQRAAQVLPKRPAIGRALDELETLADARTLQDADRAYVESSGSFKTLLVSLLTSDSFLMRTVEPFAGSK